jgi:molybdate transport system substrate-binding protein
MSTELHVIAGGGIAGALDPLAAEFETASGHTVAIGYGTVPELIALAKNTPFDAVVVPREFLKDADATNRLAGATIDIAQVGLGIAVRAGTPKPDIATPEATKRALLAARSIATVPASAAGAQVMTLLEQLGVRAEIEGKLQAAPGPAAMIQAIAAGRVDLGLFLINVLRAPGLEVVGPVPAELDRRLVYTAGIARDSARAEVARAFVSFLQMPAAKALLAERGLTPL